ncbi:MAG: glutamate--tRNA ligase [Pseudomonadota bacterium]
MLAKPIVRFAPSPTGHIHIGNVRTAILNALFARREGGTFVLRFDDTDQARARAEYADAIADDLDWLGLTPDVTLRQTDRLALYESAADRLKAMGRLYPCYETPEELERRRRLQRARGLPPVYDRAALKLSGPERAALEAEGRTPHWRFRLANVDAARPDAALAPVPTDVAWDDLIRGPQTVDIGSQSDPVMIRADGSFLYTFTSVVDDADVGVTHIIRGEDHVTNTAVQLQLFAALGADAPTFAHHSLLVGADGAALSKRMGDLSIQSFRADGLEPMTVASLAALVGTSNAIEPMASVDALADSFGFEKISRAPGRFDPKDLDALNAKLLQSLSFEAVAERLAGLEIGGGADFWMAIRGNIQRLDDAATWWQIVAGPIQPIIENETVTAAAVAALPDGDLTAETWGAWTNAVKKATGAKGRKLFMPIRLALTGKGHGPELAPLLPLIGRETIIRRLSGETA